MMSPFCLLYDCDGTLVDSEPLLAEEMERSLTEAGLTFRASDYTGEFRGARFRHIVATLEARYGRVDAERLKMLEQRMRANLDRRLASDLKTIEGAVEALAPERVILLPDGVEDLWNAEFADLVTLA